MAKISRSDIKTLMKIDAINTTYDDLIDQKIASAYAYLDEFTAFDTTSERYSDYLDVLDGGYIYARGSSKDIVLTAVAIDGTAISVSTDLSVVDFGKWHITNTQYSSGDRFYIQYTSVNLTVRVKEILKELIIYELSRMPQFDNYLSTRKVSIGDQTTQEWVSDDYMNRNIRSKLEKLLPRML